LKVLEVEISNMLWGLSVIICFIDYLIIFAKEILIVIGDKWVDHEG